MTSADHPFTPEDVQAWVDGEVAGERADALQAHVASCDDCTDLVASIRATSSAMQEWRVEPAPSSLVVKRPQRRHAWLQWAAPAAAALLITAVVIWPRETAPETPEKAESVEMALTGADYDQSLSVADRGLGDLRSPQPPSADKPGPSGLKLQSLMRAQSAGNRPAMVVRTATLSLLVADVEKARAALDSIVNRVGGFIGKMDTSGGRGEGRWLTTTLRVPEQRLAESIVALKALGGVQAESQGGEDVTNQAADLDARLANARETEKRLVTVLQQRTGRVADVLEVEREIARVRESIELMTSQREQLKDRVTYATISLRITEEPKASLDLGTPSISGRFRNALVEGTTVATEAALAISLFLIRVAPSVLLAALVFAWPAWVLWKRSRTVL